MHCCNRSTHSPSLPQIKTYLEKPITKAALFVITFLFELAALLAFSNSLGIGATATLAALGGVTFALFAILCVHSYQKMRRLSEERRITEEVRGMNGETLVEQIVPQTELSEGFDRNDLIGQALAVKIDTLMTDHISQGPEKVAQVLQPLFDKAPTAEKVELLASMVYLNDAFPTLFLGYVLDHLVWRDEAVKQKVVEGWGDHLSATYLTVQKVEIRYGNPERPECYNVNLLDYNTVKMFEGETQNSRLKPMAETLAQALRASITKQAALLTKELKQRSPRELKQRNVAFPIGIKIRLLQSPDKPLAHSRIAPLLPHLKSVPLLVGLELSCFGRVNPWDNVIGTYEGFNDDAMDPLLEILKTNPCLRDVRLSSDEMKSKEEEFLKGWKEIWKSMPLQAPSAWEILEATGQGIRQ